MGLERRKSKRLQTKDGLRNWRRKRKGLQRRTGKGISEKEGNRD